MEVRCLRPIDQTRRHMRGSIQEPRSNVGSRAIPRGFPLESMEAIQRTSHRRRGHTGLQFLERPETGARMSTFLISARGETSTSSAVMKGSPLLLLLLGLQMALNGFLSHFEIDDRQCIDGSRLRIRHLRPFINPQFKDLRMKDDDVCSP